MTSDQAVLFAILAVVFALLIWGRWRYDLVAFGALMAAVLVGVVPAEQAFAGFGHPATLVVALVLIVSRGLSNAGVVELVAKRAFASARSLGAHVGIMAGIAAALSAVMNNVAALALLMPIDIAAASKARRSPASTLMTLSFASILGGMVTLIGTPPNIIVASFRQEALGRSFAMFDFAPVGGACAVAGVLFVSLVGWRLLPRARFAKDVPAELAALKDFFAELEVRDGSSLTEGTMEDLYGKLDEGGVEVLTVIRNGRRLRTNEGSLNPAVGDILIVDGNAESIEATAGTLGLNYPKQEAAKSRLAQDIELREAVVPAGSRIEGRAVAGLGLVRRFGVSLVGVSRQGERIARRLSRLHPKAGDVLLLMGRASGLDEAMSAMDVLPLAESGVQVLKRSFAAPAIAVFVAAVTAASLGLVYLPIALGCVAVVYILTGIIPVRDIYQPVEWSVIVLLGSLIPIGQALETSNATGLMAEGLLSVSHGYPGWVALAIVMVVTMTLSDVMNNTATAVIAAPVALEVARRVGASPDPFLMAVAVASSCAFLTPIGHKNNTLIMGPGGYRFGDYWRMGLPLEILVVLVAVPTILVVWPLHP